MCAIINLRRKSAIFLHEGLLDAPVAKSAGHSILVEQVVSIWWHGALSDYNFLNFLAPSHRRLTDSLQIVAF